MASIRTPWLPRRRAAIAAAGAGMAGLLAPPAPAGPLVRLPRPALPSVRLQDALARRRSVRSYGPGALTLAELSGLLWAAQGVTGPDGLRSAPSAGALHPLELYVQAARVEGLAPGIYRYDVAAHALEPVHPGEPGRALAQAAGSQSAVVNAPLVVAIAAVTSRTAARYGGRSERYVVFEGGAAAQNLALAAVALGLGSVVIGAFDDAAVARALRLPIQTHPVALLPVGRR